MIIISESNYLVKEIAYRSLICQKISITRYTNINYFILCVFKYQFFTDCIDKPIYSINFLKT